MNVVLWIGLVYVGLVALNFLAVLWFGVCFNEVSKSFGLLRRWKYLKLMLIPIVVTVGIVIYGTKEKIKQTQES